MDPEQIRDAVGPQDIDPVRSLFREYESWLGVSLCFQGFEKELAGLPGDYAPPSGRLFLLQQADRIGGCAALRRIDDETCEMKRLFLRSDFRGRGLGRRLATTCIDAARSIGYRRMRLDTLPQMREAIALYRALGFRDIPPYRHNPVPGALYLELDLR